MGKLDGRCMCGKVTYSCDAEPLTTVVCHCSDCQRQTGTSFSVVVVVPKDDLKIEGELGSFATVGEDSGKEVDRRFCRDCGSPILSYSEAIPTVAILKAGSLEDTSWLDPQMHIWSESAQPWVELDSLPGNKLPRGIQQAG